ncbi:hypothetical protein HYX07_04980 [Candidatus Woesearchaeota archaeon]|nr:hypothetical protein [Candidatus Woesearchaeota archaeon]
MDRGNEGVIRVKKYIYEKFGIKSIITNEEDSKREHIDIRVSKIEHQKISKEVYSNFINKFGYKIEVKKDDTANRTGNIYFEIWSNVSVNPPRAGAISECRSHSIWYVLNDRFLVFNRESLISCLITHLYYNTTEAKRWKQITSKSNWKPLIKKHIEKYASFIDNYGNNGGEIELCLMPAGVNSDVRGILIPIEDIVKLKEKIGLIDAITVNL